MQQSDQTPLSGFSSTEPYAHLYFQDAFESWPNSLSTSRVPSISEEFLPFTPFPVQRTDSGASVDTVDNWKKNGVLSRMGSMSSAIPDGVFGSPEHLINDDGNDDVQDYGDHTGLSSSSSSIITDELNAEVVTKRAKPDNSRSLCGVTMANLIYKSRNKISMVEQSAEHLSTAELKREYLRLAQFCLQENKKGLSRDDIKKNMVELCSRSDNSENRFFHDTYLSKKNGTNYDKTFAGFLNDFVDAGTLVVNRDSYKLPRVQQASVSGAGTKRKFA